MRYRILNTIGKMYDQEARKILEGCGVVDYRNFSQREFLKNISQYEVLLVGIGLNVNREVIQHAHKLKIIATVTTGLDHIDVPFAETHGIKVISLRGEDEVLKQVMGTAELAWGLLVSLVRFIPFAFDSVRKNEWKRENFRGHGLIGKKLGIVGLGRLGKMVAHYGHSFGMKVLFTDPFVETSLFPVYQKTTFDELIQTSDIISVHVHLKEDTENLFCKTIFAKMKPTAYLINTSRGKIVNEADLLNALHKKQISGYASDVLSDELEFERKVKKKHPLVEYARNHSNVIIVPHIGGMTYEGRALTDIFIAKKIKKYLYEHKTFS